MDRFTAGFIAGVVAGAAQNAINLVSFYLGLATLRY